MNIKRKIIALSLVVGAVGMAGASGVDAKTAACTSTTKLNWAGQSAAIGAIPLNVALKYDLDAKYCMDISVVEVASGSQILAAIVGKSADVTTGTIDNFMGWQSTKAMTVFREIQTAPFFDVVVRKDFAEANGLTAKSDFKTVMAALAKGKLGITSAGGASEATWKQLISGAGTSLTGVLVPGALSAATIAAQFTAKTTDAVITWEPNTTLLTEGLTDDAAPLAVELFKLKEPSAGMPKETDTPGLTLGASTDWFLANQALAKNIDAMLDESIAWAKNPKNFAKVVELVVEKSKISNARAISITKRYLNYFNPSGAINRGAWDLTGPWFAANLPTVVKGNTYTSANFVYDFSERQIKALGVKKAYSGDSLAKALDLAVRPGSKIAITTTTPSVCKVTATGIEGKKVGTCDLTVTVTDKKAVGQQAQSRFARTFLVIKK